MDIMRDLLYPRRLLGIFVMYVLVCGGVSQYLPTRSLIIGGLYYLSDVGVDWFVHSLLQRDVFVFHGRGVNHFAQVDFTRRVVRVVNGPFGHLTHVGKIRLFLGTSGRHVVVVNFRSLVSMRFALVRLDVFGKMARIAHLYFFRFTAYAIGALGGPFFDIGRYAV